MKKEKVEININEKEIENKKIQKNNPKKLKQEDEIKDKKKFTIIQILAYFIIYSIIGFFIETVYGLLTKGVLESRRSFLYGPFCGIYGVGAVIMIIGLQRFKKNNYTLFLGGFIIGSIIEYIISLIGELIFNIKWWDYSDRPFNINGRVCVGFSMFWGLLAIYLMTHLKPKVDKFLEKIPHKTLKTLTIILTIIIIIDCIITGFVLKMFFIRLVNNYDLDIKGVEQYIDEYTGMYSNPEIKEFVDKYFSDERILKTFPNIKVVKKDGNIIWICDILEHIQPYYVRIFTPR